MYSGIIRDLGKIKDIIVEEKHNVLVVESPVFGSGVRLSDSVGICGVCLTVVKIEGNCAYFDVATETRRKTNLETKHIGDIVNVELSMTFGDQIHGHFVQGHVDAVAKVLSRVEEDNTVRFTIEVPEAVRGMIVPKGSVAVDGVSLTVGEVDEKSFAIYIIPHTLELTNFSEYVPGTVVNIEADCLARYVRGACEAYLTARA